MSESISESLAAIVPSAQHVAAARALGIDPAAHLHTIQTRATDLTVSLRQFVDHLPVGDPNAAKLSDLIARLA